MKAVQSTRPGPPETLEYLDLPDPLPGPGEVVVEVRAAALNFFDTLIIVDRYQVKPPRPFAPAGECAGVVTALGAGVTAVAVGDRVAAYVGYGAAQEMIRVRPDQLVKLPDALSFERAAGLIVTYGTTLHALRDRAKLTAGETLAVLGAAGGAGAAAVEIGHLMGAHVIACASSADKLAFCRSLGADAIVDYGREDLKDRLRVLTSGAGVDVVYDPVGGPYAEMALRATGWAGRYLVIGFAAGEIPRVPLNLLLLKGCAMIGVYYGEWTRRDPVGHRATLATLFEWAAAGRLLVPVEATYRFAEAAKALDAIATRQVRGKVILVP